MKGTKNLGGLGRIKLRIRISLDSTWDSCPRFPELLNSAGLGSLQAKLQSDCHEGGRTSWPKHWAAAHLPRHWALALTAENQDNPFKERREEL